MIALRNVSKCFKLYRTQRGRLMELLGLAQTHQPFWALRGIDLDVPPGKTVGIIGANGAGKSTLLKLICGTLLPTTGTIDVKGRVAALLELGMGFHQEFSGRQNIHVNGQLLGLSPEEIQALEPGIIEFSELGSFIDQPLRTYSSGMVVRLGFSIAAALEPDVLIVDEALSVGDARFSQKCIRRIRQFRDRGTTILFVSHDPAAVSSLCEEAILLHEGRMKSRGTPKEILEEYNSLLAAVGEGNVAMRTVRSADGDPTAPSRSGTFMALVTGLRLLNTEGTETEVYTPGDTLVVEIDVLFLAPVAAPTVGLLIKERLGLHLFGTNTALRRMDLGPCRAGESLRVRAEIPLRLGYGDYSLTVAVHEDETHLESCYEWTDNAAIFRIRHREKENWSGMVYHDAEMRAERTSTPGSPERWAETLEQLFPRPSGDLPVAEPDPPASPFLHGFSGPVERHGRAVRQLSQRATLLVPAGEQRTLSLRLETPAARQLRVRWIATEDVHEYNLPEGTSEIAVPLPQGWKHALAVCLLELPGAEEPELALHAGRIGQTTGSPAAQSAAEGV